MHRSSCHRGAVFVAGVLAGLEKVTADSLHGLSIGDLLAEPGQDAATAVLAAECFELSDNFVTIHRIYPDAGLVSLADGRWLRPSI